MERQVLVDYIPFLVTPQQINESMAKNGGRVIVEGVLQRSGAKNQNGRIYPKEILAGNILKELLKAGILLGISSRGLGSVKELDEGTVAVEDDFELICWDFVSNPSTHGAFMKPIQSENTLSEGVVEVNNSYNKVNTIIRDILCEMKGCCPVDQGIIMIRMKKILSETKQEENYKKLNGKQRQLVVDAVNKFNKFEQHVYRQKDVKEVVEAIKTISEYAGRLALDETEDWFDGVTVKKDVKEINDSVKMFEKTAKEVSTLQHRLEAMYENIGGKLSRYYEIADIDNTAPIAPKNNKITEKNVFYTDKKGRKRKFD